MSHTVESGPLATETSAPAPKGESSRSDSDFPTAVFAGGQAVLPWQIEARSISGHFKVFEVATLMCRSSRSGQVHPFYVLEGADWVNVIPITAEGRVVLVKQWRHGAQEVTLEIPGGIIDPGETPQAAAARELLEETGCEADAVELLGEVSPNPAIHSNRCFTYLARGTRFVQHPTLDTADGHGTEEIEVVTVSREELTRLAAAGRIRHALVMVALYWLELAERSPSLGG